jgi:hypothetical protein
MLLFCLSGIIPDFSVTSSRPTNPVAQSLSRKQADNILAYEAMPDLDASSGQSFAVYQGLRKFGQGWPGDSFLERFS